MYNACTNSAGRMTIANMNWITTLSLLVRGFLVGRLALAAENLALRQQLAILHRSVPRPKLRDRDRCFWVWLSMLWSRWRSVLIIVSPATVVRWHRQGFRYYWRWKSRGTAGRPAVDAEVRGLIRRMSKENPLWACAEIHDREGVYAEAFHRCVQNLGIKEVTTAPRSPWQNPFVEIDRLHPPGLPGPCYCAERCTSQAHSDRLLQLLSQRALPHGLKRQFPMSARSRATETW